MSITVILPFFPLLDRICCSLISYGPGAGCYPGGKYSMVCFETQGTGQFLPGEGAVPNIGAVGRLERVPETRVEVLCVGKDVMTGAVESLKR